MMKNYNFSHFINVNDFIRHSDMHGLTKSYIVKIGAHNHMYCKFLVLELSSEIFYIEKQRA